jgi:hypothetical protein
MTPLHDVEHGAGSVNPGNNNGIVYVIVTSSTLVVVDHGHRRDVGDPPGWTECCLGLEGGIKNPGPTWHMPKHHGTMSADGGASWLAGKTSDLARCAISSTGLWWRQGNAGFAMKGITGWSGGNTIAGGHGQRHQGRDHARYPICMTSAIHPCNKRTPIVLCPAEHGKLPRQIYPPTL